LYPSSFIQQFCFYYKISRWNYTQHWVLLTCLPAGKFRTAPGFPFPAAGRYIFRHYAKI